MKTKKIVIVAALVGIMLVLVTACVSKTAEKVKVGNEEVATLYSVVGERAITGSSTSTGTDGSKTELTYGGGAVSIDDVNGYISKLVNEDGFLITQQAQNDGEGQTYQLGKQAGEAGKIILIDFYFADGGDTVITYTLTSGEVSPV